MAEALLANEAAIRLGFFFGILAAMAAWEVAAPRRAPTVSKAVRWYSNLGIVAVNAVLVRVFVPIPPIAVAALAEDRGWGVLNLVDPLPWVSVAAAVVVLDLAVYLQHVMFHAVPVLWRLHRMHHADLDFDVTTGARFHPVEILLSAAIKMAVVALLGAPVAGVLIFEVVLNATSLFNHGNVRLPTGADRVLRLFVVTPDMHRVHHSIVAGETNSNFGFNLPWWDRLAGTYKDQPAAGHPGMTIGLTEFRDPSALHLHRLLVQPFVGEAGIPPINRRWDGS